ncbi:tetratricopeptide repeat protein [Laspinema palackyanum]|uniref:tetratricopeptide repeat protein n=1 Tax=Laspinema palackyanum TaxID=3231601 RepID=UPI00345CE863|nr:tetratricopeptide repeat protein [Laspinema sp. D2c]
MALDKPLQLCYNPTTVTGEHGAMNPPTPKEQIEALQSELIQLRKRGDRTESRQDNRHAESEILGKLGIAYYQDQQWHSAIATLTEYLNLARELGNQTNEAVAHYYLGFTQQAIAEFEQAVAAFFQGYRLFRQLQQHQFAATLWQQLVQQAQGYLQNQQVPEAVALYKRQIQVLLEFDDLKASAEIAVELGKVYYSQQDFPEAIGCFTSALDTAQTLKDQTLENVALAWLGCSHWQGGDLSQGLQYLEQRLALVQQLENTAAQQETLTWLIQICQQLDHPDKLIQSYQLQANFWQQQGEPVNQHLSLYELAIYQFNRQQYPEALSGFQLALELANTLNDDQGKSWKTANNNYMLGECYRNLGENQAAISPYQQAVELYLQLGAKDWAEKGLGHLLNLYRELQQAEQEIDCQKKRFQLIQDRGDDSTAYSLAYGIGNLYNHRQQFTQALEYYQEALILAKNLEPPQNLANAAYMVADCYRNLRQQQAAISGYEQAVGLYVEVNETKWALSGLDYLVNLYRQLKQDEQVIASYQRRLEIFRELGDRISEQSCLSAIGKAYKDNNQWQKAIDYFKQFLTLARELERKNDQAYSHYMLALCYKKIEQIQEAIENYQLSSQFYREVNDIKWMANASHYLANIYLYDYPIEKAESIEQAIGIYQDNLTVYSRETYPQDWAKTQNALGNAYFKRIRGDKAENLEIAIRYYEAALEVYTREAYPKDWARAQNNLGITYENRIHGGKADNLEKVISYYKAALDIRTREAYPEDWARTQDSLGDVYISRIHGDKADNLEKAIAYYNAALEIRTREAYPENWAYTQNSLGSAYEKRIRGDKADNLEKAIAYYNAALEIRTREAYPENWAYTQNSLGLIYLSRIRGDKADNLEKGIAAFNAALQVYTHETLPEDWAMLQMNLGNTYTRRIRGEKAENLEIAISYHNAALTVYNCEKYPKDWATVQINLGLAYRHRIHGEKAENQAISLAYYNASLEVLTQQEFPEYWAKVQLNLGVAYSKRIQGDKAENLEKAIAFDNAALEVFTQEAFPEEWAMVQMNLGSDYRQRIKGQKSQNLEIAIAHYTSALEVFTKQAFPENWASGQNRLGNIFLKRICGNKAENLDQAFRYYNAALEVYTRKNYPEDWAAIQNDVGIIYYKQLQGNKAENLEMAIAAYERALEINSYYEANPEDWAITQNNLGNAYRDRISGEKAQNLEMAIAAYKSALIVRTPEKYPEDWADTQYNIGFTYINRIQGEKADNIEKAIIAYENALEIYIKKVFPPGDNSAKSYFDLDSQAIIEDNYNSRKSALVISDGDSESHDYNYWVNQCVSLQMNLARSYVNRIKGDKSENLGKAIDYHKASLKLRPREAFPEEWAEIKLLLGLVYTDQIVTNQDQRFLSEAIRCYQGALEIRTLEKVPEQWAEIQFFIGEYYYYSDPRNLKYREQAIIAYEAALTVYSPENNPQRWADIQSSLGIIYTNTSIILVGKADNIDTIGEDIEKAISYNQLALTVYTKEKFPKQWAEVQLSLGVAYGHRPKGDGFDNYKKSLAAYQAALSVYNKHDFPEQWAKCNLNFSSLYLSVKNWFREKENAENIEKAIAAIESALEVFDQENHPLEYAIVQHNFAEAYKVRVLGNEDDNLNKAILAGKASLTVQENLTVNPISWGNVNLILGDIYIHLFKRKNLPDCLQEARFYYERSLEVFRLESYPERWAESIRCLANVYIHLNDSEKVINLYQQSLQVFTRLAFPQKHSVVLSNLGIVYLNSKNYHLAYKAFAEAIDTVEYLRGEVISGDEAKRKFNEEWIKPYVLMVESCIQLNRYDKALEYADRSKARNLSELIAARDLYGSDIPESTRLRLQQIRQDIAKEKERLQQTSQPDSNYLNQLREEFNRHSPYQPLTFEDIKNLLNEETAIIEWYVSFESYKFLTFTILPNLANQPSEPDSEISLWQSSPQDLIHLIDWTNAYLNDYRNNKTQWHNNLPQRLEQLAQILHLDEILHNLREKFPNCKKLILIPHRFLHLFPLHALPVPVIGTDGVGVQCLRPISRQNGNQEGLRIAPLQELFPKGVAYAPNCQVLQQAQNRQRPDFNQLFAIQNPTQDLDFTDIEVAAIQSLFNPHHILQYDAAEKAAILDGDNLKNAHCTHFSCHGYFNFEDALKSALLLAKSEFTPPPPNEDQSRYIPLQNGNLLDLGKCLTIEDILRLDLSNCRLVTLSACETGITDFNSTSDEYIGLPSGFILAGAPNVVCSLWAVNDLSTALLMIRFYQNVKNGETVPLALKQAQIWLRDVTVEGLQVWSSQLMLRSTYRGQFRRRFSKMEGTAKPFASPYYWAGFCAIGA